MTDGVIVRFQTTIVIPCETIYKPIGWLHHDKELRSNKILEVYGKKCNDVRLIPNIQEISEEYVSHELDSRYFEANGEFILENKIPQKQSGRICRVYKRPDNSKHTIKEDIGTYHLDKKHLKIFP